MAISVSLDVHSTSDAWPIDTNRAFPHAYRPVDAVFSILVRAESLNPGKNRCGESTCNARHLACSQTLSQNCSIGCLGTLMDANRNFGTRTSDFGIASAFGTRISLRPCG